LGHFDEQLEMNTVKKVLEWNLEAAPGLAIREGQVRFISVDQNAVFFSAPAKQPN